MGGINITAKKTGEPEQEWYYVEIVGSEKHSLGKAKDIPAAIEKLNKSLAAGQYPEINKNSKPAFLIVKNKKPKKYELEIIENKGERTAKLKS